MNEVSCLSNEIVSEYAKISSKPLSVEEYLNIRQQALNELDRGYAVKVKTELAPIEKVNKVKTETRKPSIAPPVEMVKADTEEIDPFFAICDALD